jgi:hypothetical protein
MSSSSQGYAYGAPYPTPLVKYLPRWGGRRSIRQGALPPKKSIYLALFLLAAGILFGGVGGVVFWRHGVSEAIPFWVMSGIAFIPGSYHCFILLLTWYNCEYRRLCHHRPPVAAVCDTCVVRRRLNRSAICFCCFSAPLFRCASFCRPIAHANSHHHFATVPDYSYDQIARVED